MKKTFLFAAITAATMFTACNKNKDKVEPPKTKTRAELLTAGKWQLKGYEEEYKDSARTVTEDYYDDLEPCFKDNYILFGADMKLTADEGPTRCDSITEQTTTGTWAFIENDTKVIFTIDGDSDTSGIAELSADVFKIAKTTTYMNVYTLTTTRTYARIN